MMENKGFNHLDTEDKFGCTSILWSYRDSMDCATDPPLLEKAICDSNVSSVHYYVKNNPSQLQEDAEALDMNLITTIEISKTSTGYKYQNQSYRLLYILTKGDDGKEGCEVKLTRR
ncbi:hypothetical protein N9933_01565 [bacterium]|nr:hypothetical protein [bacterium]